MLPLHAFRHSLGQETKCVLDYADVSYVPSLAVLDFLRSEGSQSKTALLVSTADVPGGINEVVAVERVLKENGFETILLIDCEATRENVSARLLAARAFTSLVMARLCGAKIR